jgi:hypothetical protein
MYEHKSKPLASRKGFYQRVFRNLFISLAFLAFSLSAGVLGYRVFCEYSWLDALLNASMILGGMGPVNPVETASGKVFASIYALYSGVAFLGAFAFMLAPLYHRFLHLFHLEDEEKEV